ncbi:MAG: GIY-YIG nuclease family protein [Candidatus Omnitrophica bacterium]|nr:GIY-YIG nuclease family protein [Candidatus Omnitrophota bacterium]
MWYVYILKCNKDRLYTGITNNVDRRFKEHTSRKGGRFTKAFGARKLLYAEEQPNKSHALKREVQIKGWSRKKKLALIRGDLKLLKKL